MKHSVYYDDVSYDDVEKWWDNLANIQKSNIAKSMNLTAAVFLNRHKVEAYVKCTDLFEKTEILTKTIRRNIGHSDADITAHDEYVNRLLKEYGITNKENLIKISATPYPDVLFTTITYIANMPKPHKWRSQE